MKRKLDQHNVPTTAMQPEAEQASNPTDITNKPDKSSHDGIVASASPAPSFASEAEEDMQHEVQSAPKVQRAESFTSLGLDPRLLQALNKMQFPKPTAVQGSVVPAIMGGEGAGSIMVKAKTGSGKTLAYLLPILDNILRDHSKTTAATNSSATKASSGHASSPSALILVPTRDLATQTAATLKQLTTFTSNDIRSENITRKEDATVTRARLAQGPDVVVATPSKAAQWVNDQHEGSGALGLNRLKYLVLDEADLLLSYGYSDDLTSLSHALTSGVQTIMLSATLTPQSSTQLTSLLFGDKSSTSTSDSESAMLDLTQDESAEENQEMLKHYVLPTTEQDKFLLLYAIFKLKLIKGKTIIYVGGENVISNDSGGRGGGRDGGAVDRCYRVRLFLEQFGIRSVVLNPEMPVQSRGHVAEEFNRGVHDILIACEGEITDSLTPSQPPQKRRRVPNATEEAGEEDGGAVKKDDGGKILKKRKGERADEDDALTRGLDFRHVTCVLNFDLPTSAKIYVHRVGRTARAGQTGIALSFYIPKDQYGRHKPTSIPQCKFDEIVVREIRKELERKEDGEGEGNGKGLLEEWRFDLKKLEGFRYRFEDALRSVTRIAVRDARTRELRNELINSKKLERHFEENPQDLKHLRHDNTTSHGMRTQSHLRHIPDYLLPDGGAKAMAKDVGFVGLRSDKENRNGKARRYGKGKVQRGKGLDPLKSLNVKGRGKKSGPGIVKA